MASWIRLGSLALFFALGVLFAGGCAWHAKTSSDVAAPFTVVMIPDTQNYLDYNPDEEKTVDFTELAG